MFSSLALVSKVRVTPTRAYPGWQKPIVCIQENGYNGLYSRLHTRYSSVIVAMKNLLGKISVREFSAGSYFLLLEEQRYCVYFYRRLYILAYQGSVIHLAFTPFIAP